jgi:2Fe-2S ferredoxin
MPKVTFIEKDGTQRVIEAEENWSLMQIAVEHGVRGIDGACGGAMACATCHCYIAPEWVARVEAADNEKSDEENDMLDVAFDVRETSRLGCQVKVTQELDGLRVGLPGVNTNWQDK